MTGIILAAGKSTRMGTNKLLLDFKRIPIIEHSIRSAKNSNLTNIILVVASNDLDFLAKKYAIEILYNQHADKGQSQSIVQAVRHCHNKKALLFMVADNPLLKTQTINEMIELYEKSDMIIVPEYKKEYGNPVIFPSRFFMELKSLTGDCGGKIIIKNHRDEVIIYQATEEVLFDVDTKKDYDQLKKRS
ncbi:MAG: nucleotidyltransferase family protein [Treponemataceae bacterium]